MARKPTMARERHASEENDVILRVVGETKGGKKLLVGQDSNGYFYPKFHNGGQLPRELMGRFTRYEYAEQAIKRYLKE